ncbi:hypothetical protein MKY96_32615 [Paenibacillus sp. FSL R7-0302]|uniref:hypothetical protein n=1 Tax=Paenibacillus sp. FSL R7-0302 TaxID=2921681 RepID=UPI0030FCDA09
MSGFEKYHVQCKKDFSNEKTKATLFRKNIKYEVRLIGKIVIVKDDTGCWRDLQHPKSTNKFYKEHFIPFDVTEVGINT